MAWPFFAIGLYNSAMMADSGATGWALDPQIGRDTMPLGDMALCRVLLMRDANFPWLLLVPRRPHAVEIMDLDSAEQAELMAEIAEAARALEAVTRCDKINIAALGNVVAQLHVHVIARSRGDVAWPRPVWNVAPPRAYDEAALATLVQSLRQRLALTAI